MRKELVINDNNVLLSVTQISSKGNRSSILIDHVFLSFYETVNIGRKWLEKYFIIKNFSAHYIKINERRILANF